MGISWLYVVSAVMLLTSVIYYLLPTDKFDEDRISKKKVLITGASQNIGKHLAFEYAKLGANIVITSRNARKLEEVAKRCLQMGASSVNFIAADMSKLNETEKVVTTAVAILGGLDFLVINHVYNINPFFWNETQSNLDIAQKASVVNYLSYIYLSTHAIPHLTKTNGHLIIVSSLAGYIYTAQNTLYSSTKAALNVFYSDLRLEMALRKKKTYSITICMLGPIATDDTRWEKNPNKLKMSGYPVEDTAKEIMIGGANRRAYVFIPSWTRICSILRVISTDFFDNLYLRFLYNVES